MSENMLMELSSVLDLPKLYMCTALGRSFCFSAADPASFNAVGDRASTCPSAGSILSKEKGERNVKTL